MSTKLRNIAIIGSGISGLTAAHLLHKRYNIKLFEANSYVGGHTNTISVGANNQEYHIDTGFIVFNQKTYPNFVKLLDNLQVPIQASNMSFSVSSEGDNIEYSGDTLNSLFAQRKNLFSPKFYRLLLDIYRFNNNAKALLSLQQANLSLNEFYRKHNYSGIFRKLYLDPLTSAIWSTPIEGVGEMLAEFVFQFYANHGLLDLIDRPKWYVVQGGSYKYIEKLIKPFAADIFTNTPVVNITRYPNHITIDTDRDSQRFDAVVIACHSDQALNMLADATEQERSILGSIPYNKNLAILHTDTTSLPQQRRAWASWNYKLHQSQAPTLTYYMNKLQSITSPEDFCVSINTPGINPKKIITTIEYSHPFFTLESQLAKQQHKLINGTKLTYFVGAYWGNGFHEDGVLSSLTALSPLGVSL